MDRAIGMRDEKRVAHLLKKDYRKQKAEKDQFARAMRDPSKPANRKLLDDYHRQQRIDQSLEQCMEENPEMFGKISMLYIDVIVNHHKVKAFVDSGAQMTIISRAYAMKFGVLSLFVLFMKNSFLKDMKVWLRRSYGHTIFRNGNRSRYSTNTGKNSPLPDSNCRR